MFRRIRTFGRRYSTSVPRRSSAVPYAVGGVLFGAGVLAGQVGHFDSPIKNSKIYEQSTAPLKDVEAIDYADYHRFELALAEFKAIVGEGNWSVSQDEIKAVSDLFFSTHRPPKPEVQKPAIIISPANTGEVSAILKVANKYHVPIVANSGMTSLEGHTMHTRGPNSVSLSFSRMDKILEFHPEDLDVVVQPAVGWQDLDEFLRDRDDGKHLIFGPDPGMGATIGGMASTSASGTNAYRYGTMKENVVNLTVVLADGTILKTRQRPRKSSAGYDLTRLFIGQEGTLGLITEITVKLNVRPKYEFVTIASFPTLRDATKTASEIVGKSGLQLNAIELLNGTTVGFVNKSGSTSKKFDEQPTLLMKIGGPTLESIHQDTELVKKLAKQNGVSTFETSRSLEENASLWAARRNGLFSTIEHGQLVLEDKDDVQIWTTDIAVPLSSLPQVIDETSKDLEALGYTDKFGVFGHVGDGNVHFLVLYNKKDYAKTQTVVERMVERAIKFQGTCTGEHGVGVGKRKFLSLELGTTSVDLMRKIKYSLDPNAILNPDKILRLEEADILDDLLEQGHVTQHSHGCC